VNFIEADLENYKLPEERYDLIINFNYLERVLVPKIVAALKPGGMLLFETFTCDQRRFGPPRNEAYLLRKGELKELFKGLDVMYFWEGVLAEKEKKKAVARLLAIKTVKR
jgi:SAM-dependent methyltransferase